MGNLVPAWSPVARAMIAGGALLMSLGVAWPWVSRLPWGRLPGDIVVRKEHLSVWIPVTTCLLLSAVLTLLVWVWRR